MQTDVSDLAAFRAANPKPRRDVVVSEVMEFPTGRAFAKEIGRAVEQSPRAQPLTPMTRHMDNFLFSGTAFTPVPPHKVNVSLGLPPPWKTEREEIVEQLNKAITLLHGVDNRLKSAVNRGKMDDAMRLLRELRNEF